MAVVTARALKVEFRHGHVHWWEGPEKRIIDGDEYVGGKRILISRDAAPSWSITEPTGFSFAYLLGRDEQLAFFAQPISSVPVTVYRFYREESSWIEQVQWRFEGVIGNAVWDVEQQQVQCTVVPVSRTAKLRPHVRLWSRESLNDTGFRWMRAKHRPNPFQGGQVG